jgi:hypothetical protein
MEIQTCKGQRRETGGSTRSHRNRIPSKYVASAAFFEFGEDGLGRFFEPFICMALVGYFYVTLTFRL